MVAIRSRLDDRNELVAGFQVAVMQKPPHRHERDFAALRESRSRFLGFLLERDVFVRPERFPADVQFRPGAILDFDLPETAFPIRL